MNLFNKLTKRKPGRSYEIDSETNFPKSVEESIKQILSVKNLIKRYYSKYIMGGGERKAIFLEIADKLSGVEDAIKMKNISSIVNIFSIANSYNKKISYLLGRYKQTGPFLPFPKPIDDCLNLNKEMIEIGNFLFESRASEGTFNPVSLIDYLNDFSDRDYRLMDIKTALLGELIGNQKLEDKLRISAFEKLEQLSEVPANPEEGNENYQISIGKKDYTYYDFVIKNVIIKKNKQVQGFREAPRNVVVQNALQIVGFNMTNYKPFEMIGENNNGK